MKVGKRKLIMQEQETRPVDLLKDGVENSIKSIGNSLIERAEDIARDLDKVSEIVIYAKLSPLEVVNFEISKTYTATITEEKKTKEITTKYYITDNLNDMEVSNEEN